MIQETLLQARFKEQFSDDGHNLNFYDYVRFILIDKHTFLILLSLVFSSMAGVTLCSCDNPQNHNINIEKIISDYIENHIDFKDGDIRETVKQVRLWRQERDSINKLINTIDNTDKRNRWLSLFNAANDSIRFSLDKALDETSTSFSDYWYALSELSEIEVDTSSKEVMEMIALAYKKSVKSDALIGNAKEVVRCYEQMLEKSLMRGFSTLDDVLGFLVVEDIHFRSFLSKLNELGSLSLETIVSKSERVMRDILYLTAISDAPLSKSEAVVILTMRNNHRVIQNAVQCKEDLSKNKVYEQARKDAYLWMLLQPFLVLDNFSYVLLTDEQRNEIEGLVTFLEEQKDCLCSADFAVDADKLPDVLTRELIERYVNHIIL